MLSFHPDICSVANMLKSEKCGGEGKYQFLQHFVKEPKLKVILATSVVRMLVATTHIKLPLE